MSGIKHTISARMKAARNNLKISQDKLIEKINKDPDRPKEKNTQDPKTLEKETYRRWEDGTNGVNLDWIPTLCKHLACDVGYLFGCYEEFTKAEADICSSTGLSPNAVRSLAAVKSTFPHNIEFLSPSSIISDILSDPDFLKMIQMIYTLTYKRMDILRNQARKEFVAPWAKEEYISTQSAIKTDIENMKSIVEDYGYSIIDTEELLLTYQYQFRQSMDKVVNNTLCVINQDIDELFETLKKDSIRNSALKNKPE